MTFEEAIKTQQQGKYRIDEHKWPEMTIGDLIGAVLAIHAESDAKSFWNGYLEWLRALPQLDPRGPEYVAIANIGWCFGEGMPESDRAIWRGLGIGHPVFGAMKENPSPEKAFQAGLDAARR